MTTRDKIDEVRAALAGETLITKDVRSAFEELVQLVILPNAVVVIGMFHAGPDVLGLEAACSDYVEFKKLPVVVEFKGRKYGKSGWDSDKGRAYFRTDVTFAEGV